MESLFLILLLHLPLLNTSSINDSLSLIPLILLRWTEGSYNISDNSIHSSPKFRGGWPAVAGLCVLCLEVCPSQSDCQREADSWLPPLGKEIMNGWTRLVSSWWLGGQCLGLSVYAFHLVCWIGGALVNMGGGDCIHVHANECNIPHWYYFVWSLTYNFQRSINRCVHR